MNSMQLFDILTDDCLQCIFKHLNDKKSIISFKLTNNRLHQLHLDPDITNQLDYITIKNKKDLAFIPQYYTKLKIERNQADISLLKHYKTITHLSITGKITNIEHFIKFDRLKELRLDHCDQLEHQNSIRVLKNLINITHLYVYYCKYIDLSFIINYKQLNVLLLSSTFVKNFHYLYKMNQLNTLIMLFVNINSLNISKLTQLKRLSLAFNKITNCKPLANLTQLKVLDLSRNKITDCSPLANLTQLSYLNLSDNKITDFSQLIHLDKLKVLSMGYNENLDCSSFQYLKNLQYLNIQYVGLNDISTFGNLSQNVKIYLYDNHIIRWGLRDYNIYFGKLLNFLPKEYYDYQKKHYFDHNISTIPLE